MSTPEKAEAIAFNGISWQNKDYYYYDKGKVYLWGYYTDESRGLTYEHKWGGAGGAYWADPRPRYEEDIFWNNQDVVGDREMGTLAEWGFETYWSEWDGSRINGNAETGGNTDVEYQRKVTYWFRRFKNYPETKGVIAWGESYASPDGKVHWQRPGETMRVQVNNFQDYPGWRIQLDDYVNQNYIQLVNKSGNIAKNYAKLNNQSGAYEWLPEVTMTNNWNGQSADKQSFYTQFDVTITGGENDYRIDTYAASANGKEVGYNSSGEYIKIDNSAPSGTWSSTATANVWTNQNVVLKFQPTDARSGVNRWSYRTSTNDGATYSGYSAIIYGDDAKDFSVTTEGKNKIISDLSDNVSWYNEGVPSEAYWIDKTAPTANAVASSTAWTNADVTLSVNSASDALSGFDRITLPNNSTTTNTSASQVVSANASYTFAIRDVAGNITNKTITVGNIDKVAPTANNVTASTTAWTNSNVTLTLTGAADALSGFSKIVLPDGTSTTNTSASYSASTNGTYTFKVYDNAGNVTNKSITVTNIDKVAPTVTMPGTIQNETTDYFDVVATNVADAGSGIDRVQFPTWTSLNGQDDIQSSWTTNSAASGAGVGTTYTYRVNRSAHNWEFGDYNVHVYVYDRAGNATSFAMPVHNKKDMTPPNVTTAGNDPAWTTSKTIVVTASDDHTGLTNITTPNGTTILNTGKGVVSTQSHVVNANGNFVYSATDKYGNTTSRAVTVSSVDTQAPTGTEYGNPTGWTNANFDMGIKDIVENQSGYDHATLPNGTTTTSTNPWQTISANGTYSYTLYDKVGNSKTYTEVVNKIDKAAPTGTITASPTNWTNGNVTLTLNANDTGGSGVYRIMDDSGAYTVGAVDTFVATANGTYDFTVYDNAGNSKVVSYTVSNIDKTSPGLTVTQNPSAWTKGEVTLTGAASDSQSGLVSIRETNTGIYAGRNLIPNSKPNQTSNLYGFAVRTLSQHLVAGQTYVLTINGRIDAQAAADGKQLRAFVWNNGWTSATSVPITSTTDTTTSIVYTPTVSGEHYFAAYLYTSGGSRLGNATLNWMKFESGSVFSGYTPAPEDSTTVAGNATFGISQNGTYTYRATDAVGNVKDTSINVTNIDKTAPGKPTIDLSTAAWTNGNVTFTITNGVDSQSGPDYTQYQVNGGAWTNYTGVVTLSADGKHVINARTTDKVGWTGATETKTASIDKVAPTGAVTASTTAWTSGNVTLTINAADVGGSGVYRIMDNAGVYTNGAVDTFVATANGTYNFTVYDNVGNSKVFSYTVTNIDKTGPTANAPTANPTTWTNGNVTISLTGAADAGGGFKNIVLPDGTSTTSTSASYTAVNDGTYTFKVYDNVGNVTDKTIVISNIDRTLPTATTYGNPTAWTNTNVDMGLINIVDVESGYDRTRLPNGTNSTSTNPWQTITGNGTYSFVLYDKAGNSQTYTEVVTKIDKAAPTGVITASPTAWTNGNVTLTLNAADTGGSGVYRIKDHSGNYTTGSVDTFVATANGTYNFTVYDNAGNSTIVSYAVTNIDKTAPTANNPTASTTAWTNGTVTLSLTGAADTGGSGFNKIVLPNGTAVTTTTASQTVSVNGTYSFDVYDNAGNVTTKSITVSNIDKAAPTGVITASPTAWTNGNVTLTLNAADTGGSGVYRIKDQTGNFTTGSVDTFVATANGTYNFTVYDNAGNSQVVSYAVSNIDTGLPSATIGQSQTSWTKELVDVNLAATDSLSGVKSIEQTNADAYAGRNLAKKSNQFNTGSSAAGITRSLTPEGYLSITADSGNGNWVYGWAKDVSGIENLLNEGDTFTVSFTMKSADTTKIPNIYIKSGMGYYAMSGKLSNEFSTVSYTGTWKDLNAIQPHLGMSGVTGTVIIKDWKIEKGTGTPWSQAPEDVATVGGKAAFSISQNGTYDYKVSDNAGNEINKSVTISNIDLVDPTLSLSPSTTGWTNSNVLVTAVSTDSQSGALLIGQAAGASENLVRMSDWNNYYGSAIKTALTDDSLSFTGSTGFDGIHLTSVAADEDYLLSFDMTKESGNITKIGGHIALSSLSEVWIDGVKQSGSFAGGITYPNDSLTHHVVVRFNSRVSTSDRRVFIQPNRGGTAAAYEVTIANTSLITGDFAGGASAFFTITDNGTHTYRSVDAAGNSSYKEIVVGNIDKIAPDATVVADTTAWTNQNVTLSLSASDLGVSGYYRTKLPNGAYTSATTFDYSVSGNGSQTFIIYDRAGNSKAVVYNVTNIDKTLPGGTVAPNTTAWTKGPVTLTFSGTDAGGSGVDYVLDNESNKTIGANDSYVISSNGTYNFTVFDKAGNSKVVSYTASNIDLTAPGKPTIDLSTAAWTNGNVTFTITPGTDSQSGVAYTQYQIDGGAWTNYTGVVTISTNGKHVINARTTDNVGWTGVTETKTASIDKVVPTAGISVNTSWTNAASVAATLTASDADSGLSSVKYQLSGATTKAETTATTGDVITIANEGQTTITLVATDAVGQTTTTTKVVKIDRTAPVFSAASISNVTESGFDVTVTVTDGLSGVNNVNLPIWRSGNYSGMKTFPHTGQGNGTHTYHVDMADIGAGADYVYIGKHVTDNAGNSAFAGDASFKLDVTAPNLAISQADAAVWTNKDVTVSSVSSDNFNGVEKLTIAGNSTTKTTDVFAKPKILSVSLASRSTVSYLIAKGYDVTVDTTVTTLAQLSGYDIILSDGQAWSADKASLLNQAFAAGYRIYSTGNDTASGAIHPVTTSSAGSGSFTLTQYANTSHVESGDYDNIMKYYDGATETDGGQLKVTAYPSDTRVLATNTLYGTASLLYSVNNNGGKWIHLQGFGPHGTMSRRILDELMLGTKATRQTYTEALTVASNGTYTVMAEDFFGNQTSQTITVSNIDKTLPGGTITSSNTAFTNGNVTLTFAGTDAGGSGVDYVLDNASNKTIGASDSYVVSSNGTYNFTIYDKAGNSKAVSYTVSNIDKSAPNATIASNVTGWTNQNVILTVSPSDIGVSGYYRTLLPNGTYSTTANPTYTATGNGAQTFVIYDNAGNSTTVTYTVGNIDKTLPGGTIAPSTTAWTNADVTLTLNATDVGGSGVDRVMNPSGVVTSGATANFTATTNGTFSFTVYDKAGNTKVVTYVVANIDKIKPVYTGNIAIANVTQDYFDVVITNVTDAHSGMNRVQFPTWTNADGQDDLGDWWSTTEYKGSVSTTTYTYRVQRSSHKEEFGLYNVHIYMFDNAGNYITAATSYVLRDQVFPLVDSITGNPTTWTNQNATLTVNGHDEHTGVKSITLPDGTVVATNSAKGANATANYTVSDNGSYTFKITDMYDNVTTQTVTVSKIDKVLPSATTQGNPVNWTNQNQTLTITGSDAGGSGFKQIKLPSGVIVTGSSATYTVSQNGSYSFVVYDNAGNSRTISEQVTKIDKEAPGGGIQGNPVSWTNKDATLTLNAADTGGAGVKGVYLPNGTFVTTTSIASYVATQNGTYTFKTVDFAGNETSVSVTVTKIDKVAPTIASVGGNPTQWSNQSQTLRVTGTDALSGVTSIKRPDNTVINGVVTDYTVHQNGGYVFILTDAAGNSATYTVDVTKIDKGNPSQSSVNISVNNSQQ
jgi:hypothetical protein